MKRFISFLLTIMAMQMAFAASITETQKVLSLVVRSVSDDPEDPNSLRSCLGQASPETSVYITFDIEGDGNKVIKLQDELKFYGNVTIDASANEDSIIIQGGSNTCFYLTNTENTDFVMKGVALKASYNVLYAYESDYYGSTTLSGSMENCTFYSNFNLNGGAWTFKNCKFMSTVQVSSEMVKLDVSECQFITNGICINVTTSQTPVRVTSSQTTISRNCSGSNNPISYFLSPIKAPKIEEAHLENGKLIVSGKIDTDEITDIEFYYSFGGLSKARMNCENYLGTTKTKSDGTFSCELKYPETGKKAKQHFVLSASATYDKTHTSPFAFYEVDLPYWVVTTTKEIGYESCAEVGTMSWACYNAGYKDTVVFDLSDKGNQIFEGGNFITDASVDGTTYSDTVILKGLKCRNANKIISDSKHTCYGFHITQSIKNCVSRNNTNGIIVESGVNIDSCIVQDNTNQGIVSHIGGGGLNSGFIKNTVVKGSGSNGIECGAKLIENCDIINNGGSGIYVSSSNVKTDTVRGCWISGNGVNGIVGPIDFITNNIIGLTKDQKKPMPNNIGIKAESGTSHSVVSNNIISGNKTYGVYFPAGTATSSTYGDFIGNYVGTNEYLDVNPDLGNGVAGAFLGVSHTGNKVSDNYFINNHGCGLYSKDFDCDLDNCMFSNNEGPGLVFQFRTVSKIVGCKFLSNKDEGVKIYSYNGNITFDDCEFKNNSSYGLRSGANTINVSNSTFDSNAKSAIRIDSTETLVGISSQNLFLNTKSNSLNAKAIDYGENTDETYIPRITEVVKDGNYIYVSGEVGVKKEGTIELFASEGPETTIKFVGTTTTDENGKFENFSFRSSKLRDLSGELCITATFTLNANTGALSDPYCCKTCLCPDNLTATVDTMFTVGGEFEGEVYDVMGAYKVVVTRKTALGCDSVVTYNIKVGPDPKRTEFYVKEKGTGKGTSWNDAMGPRDFSIVFNTIQSEDVTFYMAGGKYYPVLNQYLEEPSERNKTGRCWTTDHAVTIIGGYDPDAKGNASTTKPDFAKYPTILSGDHEGDDSVDVDSDGRITLNNQSDNSKTLMYIKMNGKSGITSISNVIFTGSADLNGSSSTALSVYGISNGENEYALFLDNCVFSTNYAGLYVGGMSLAQISNCKFENLTYAGVSFYSVSKQVKVENSTFYHCNSTGIHYGDNRSGLTLRNSTFVDNNSDFTFYQYEKYDTDIENNFYNNTFITSTTRNNSVLSKVMSYDFTGNLFLGTGFEYANSLSGAATGTISSKYNLYGTNFDEALPSFISKTDLNLGRKVLAEGILDGKYNSANNTFVSNLKGDAGKTPTVALLKKSLEDADLTFPLKQTIVTTDQRGVARLDNTCMGAYELEYQIDLTRDNYYVKENGEGDGSTWENAMGPTTFAKILPQVADGATFHVAAGNYKFSDPIEEKEASLNIIGGYPENAKDGDVPNAMENKTVFNGDSKNGTEWRFYGKDISSLDFLDVCIRNIEFDNIKIVSAYLNSLRFDSCIFVSNVIDEAMYPYYVDTVRVNSCYFDMKYKCQAIYMMVNDYLEIKNSTFTNCKTYDGHSGNLIKLDYLAGDAMISNCTFTECSSSDFITIYHRIFNGDSNGKTYFYNNTVVGNGWSPAGATVPYGGRLDLGKCVLVGNIYAGNSSCSFYETPLESHDNLYSSTCTQKTDADLTIFNDELSEILDGEFVDGVFKANLADNGGFTPTVKLLSDKFGKNSLRFKLGKDQDAFDQRGVARLDNTCMGAYELEGCTNMLLADWKSNIYNETCGRGTGKWVIDYTVYNPIDKTQELQSDFYAVITDKSGKELKSEVLSKTENTGTIVFDNLSNGTYKDLKFYWTGGDCDGEIIMNTGDKTPTTECFIGLFAPRLPDPQYEDDPSGKSFDLIYIFDGKNSLDGCADYEIISKTTGDIYEFSVTPDNYDIQNNQYKFVVENLPVDNYDVRYKGCETVIQEIEKNPCKEFSAEGWIIKESSCRGQYGGMRAVLKINDKDGTPSDYNFTFKNAQYINNNIEEEDVEHTKPGIYVLHNAGKPCNSVTIFKGDCRATIKLSDYKETKKDITAKFSNLVTISESCVGEENGALELPFYGFESYYDLSFHVENIKSLNSKSVETRDERGTLRIEDLAPGTYKVYSRITVEGCPLSSVDTVFIDTIKIKEAQPISLDVVVADNKCGDKADGSIIMTFNGWVPNSDMNWTIYKGTEEVESDNAAQKKEEKYYFGKYALPTGDYKCVFRDGCGKEVSEEVTIKDSPLGALEFEVVETTSYSCPENKDGSMIIAVSNYREGNPAMIDGMGVKPYEVSNGQALYKLTGLGSDEYTFSVLDDCNEWNEFPVKLEDKEPISLKVEVEDNHCKNIPNGYVKMSFIGWEPNGLMSWSIYKGTEEIDGDDDAQREDGKYFFSRYALAAGEYNCVFRDGCGNEVSEDVTIKDVPLDPVEFEVVETTSYSCPENKDGSIIIAVSNYGEGNPAMIDGMGVKPYEVSNGQALYKLTGLGSDEYTFSVLDDCNEWNEFPVNIKSYSEENGTLKLVDVKAVDNKCFGKEDGKITVEFENEVSDLEVIITLTGDNTSLTEKSAEPNGSVVFESLPAGDYVVTIAYECETTAKNLSKTITVAAASEIKATASTTEAACAEVGGTSTITVDGGVAPYSYKWLDENEKVLDNTESTMDGVLPGQTYSCIVTDANDCEVVVPEITSELVSLDDLKSVAFDPSVVDQKCYGVANGSVAVTLTGADDIDNVRLTLVNDKSKDSKEAVKDANGIYNFDELLPGDYKLHLSHDVDGCSPTSASVEYENTITVAEITTPLSIDKDYVKSTDPSCVGDSDGSAEAKVANWNEYYTFDAYVDGEKVSSELTMSDDAAIASVSGISGGKIMFVASDICDNHDTIEYEIKQKVAPEINLVEANAYSCEEKSDGSLILAVSNFKSSYVATLDGVEVASTKVDEDGITIFELADLGAKTYKFVVTDNCDNSTPYSFDMKSYSEENAKFKLDYFRLADASATCTEDSRRLNTAVLSGFADEYTFNIVNAETKKVVETSTRKDTSYWTNMLLDGSYYVEVIADECKLTSEVVEITSTLTAEMAIMKESLCDENSKEQSVVVTVEGDASFYAISENDGKQSETEISSVSVVEDGRYLLKNVSKDSKYLKVSVDGCFTLLDFNDAKIEGLDASVDLDYKILTSNPTCHDVKDGSITLSYEGFHGLYNVDLALVSLDGDSIFENLSSNEKSAKLEYSKLPAGKYRVTPSISIEGCGTLKTFDDEDVEIASDLSVALTLDGDDCETSIKSTITGGAAPYTGFWTDAVKNTVIEDADIESLVATETGRFVLTIEDNNKCKVVSDTISTEIVSIDNLKLVAVEAVAGKCNGEKDNKITVEFENGAAGSEVVVTLTGKETNKSIKSDELNGKVEFESIPSGEYVVSINYTTTEKCSNVEPISESVVMPTSTELKATASTTDAACEEVGGTATIIVEEGTAPYSFKWLEEKEKVLDITDSILTAVSPKKTYSCVITDANDCEITVSDIKVSLVSLDELSSLEIDPTAVGQKCYGKADGSIAINFVGGVKLADLKVSAVNVEGGEPKEAVADAAGTYNVDELLPGDYKVFVGYEIEGCGITSNSMEMDKTVTISKIDAPFAIDKEYRKSTDPTCAKAGTAEIKVDNWNENYSLKVYEGSTLVNPTMTESDGSIIAVADDLHGGTIKFVVSDLCGNSDSIEYELKKFVSPTIELVEANAYSCPEKANGSATLAVYDFNDFTSVTLNGKNVASSAVIMGDKVVFEFTELGAETYEFEIIDNCKSSTKYSIDMKSYSEENGALTIDYFRVVDPTSCEDDSKRLSTAVLSGNADEYTFNIIDAETKKVVETYTQKDTSYNTRVLPYGSYYVEVIADECKVTSETVTLENNFSVTLALGGTACTPTLNSKISGGAAPVTGFWSEADTKTVFDDAEIESLMGVGSGRFFLTLVDDKKCKIVSDTVAADLVSSDKLKLTDVNIVSNKCYGDKEGQVTVGFENSIAGAPASIYLTSGETELVESVDDQTGSVAFDKLPAGKYSIYIGYTATPTCRSTSENVNKSAVVTEGDKFTAVAATTLAPCKEVGGTATVTVEGGVAPLTYKWSDEDGNVLDNTESTITGLAPEKVYSCVVTDSKDCQASATDIKTSLISLDKLSAIEVDPTATDQKCYGVANGEIEIKLSSADTKDVIVSVVATETEDSTLAVKSKEGQYKADGLWPGDYKLLIGYEFEGCSFASTSVEQKKTVTIAKIAEPLSVDQSYKKSEDSHCYNEPNGTAEVKVGCWSKFYSMTAFEEGTKRDAKLTLDGISAIGVTSNIRGGEVKLVASDICGNKDSIVYEMKKLDEPKIELIDSHVKLRCSYSADGFLKYSFAGGDPETYDIEFNKVGFEKNDYSETKLFDELTAGNYTVIYRSIAEGCSDKVSMTNKITAPEPMINLVGVSPLLCNDEATGEFSLVPYRRGTKVTEAKLSESKNYAVEVFNGNFDALTLAFPEVQSLVITSKFQTPAELKDALRNALNMDEDEDKLTAKYYPLSELWFDEIGEKVPVSWIGFDELPSDVYTITTTDTAGCVFTQDLDVTQNPIYNTLTIDKVTFNADAAACKADDRRIEIEVSGGWGSYGFSVAKIDDMGDLGSSADSIQNSNNNDVASGGGFSTGESAAQDSTYEKDGKGYYRSAILEQGHYFISVTDSMGCFKYYNDTIEVKSNLSVDGTVIMDKCDPTAFNQIDVVASANDGYNAVGPYAFKIKYGSDSLEVSGDTMNLHANKIPSGDVGVYITDANQCGAFKSFRIVPSDTLVVLTVKQMESLAARCYGDSSGSVVFKVFGGNHAYEHFILDDDTLSHDENFMTKVDDEFNLSNARFPLSSIDLNKIGMSDTLCMTDIPVGDHKLQVSDAEGCVATMEFTITQPDTLSVTAKATGVCPDGSGKGRVLPNELTGGTTPYTYALDFDKNPDVIFTKDKHQLAELNESHRLFVKDANGCIAYSEAVTVTGKADLNSVHQNCVVSTWHDMGDVVVAVDVSEYGSTKADSVVYEMDNLPDGVTYEVVPRELYIYGIPEEVVGIEWQGDSIFGPLWGVPADIAAGVKDEAEYQKIKKDIDKKKKDIQDKLDKDRQSIAQKEKELNTASGNNKASLEAEISKLEADTLALTDTLESLHNREKVNCTIDMIKKSFKPLVPEDVMNRLTYLRVSSQKDLDMKTFKFDFKMVSYVNDCSMTVEFNNMGVAVNDTVIYKDVTKKDIQGIECAPNPVNYGGNTTVFVNLAEKMDLTYSIYNFNGEVLAQDITVDMTNIVELEDKSYKLSFDINELKSACIVTVRTKGDAASLVILVNGGGK